MKEHDLCLEEYVQGLRDGTIALPGGTETAETETAETENAEPETPEAEATAGEAPETPAETDADIPEETVQDEEGDAA